MAGLLSLVGPAAAAADPVSYAVSFQPSGDAELDSLLKQTSSLVSLRQKLPPAPFALIGRAQADAEEFATVLHSLGYDDGRVGITIDGMAPGDAGLLDRLMQAPAGESASVVIKPEKGPRFVLGAVVVTGLPPGFRPPANVRAGQPALAAPILAAAPTLTKALHNAGYAFATVSPPVAIAHPDSARLDVSYSVTPGPHVAIGAIRFAGLRRADADFLRRHIELHPGETYSDSALDAARNSLLGLGIFASVSPAPEPGARSGGAVPILFQVTELKRHAVTLSGSYATDLGISIGASWEDRDVFRHAETLTFTATANGLGGTGTTAPGYDLKTVFAKPDYGLRGQTLSVSVEGLKQSLTAYDRTGVITGIAFSRPLSAHVTLTYGPGFVAETVLQEGVRRTYVLLEFPVSLAYDTADSPLEPTRGINASLTLTPTEPVVGDRHPFLIAQGQAATYLAVEPDGRGVVALRGEAGTIQGASQFDVPPDQRFYAGGSGTVRGYTYQTIGPLFADDEPEGGTAFDAASFEFRQHVWGHFGAVPFIDAGQVSAGSAPFQGRVRVGIGIGGRYYTGIGPIRLDIAFPLTRVAGSGGFALYIGLGEAF